MAAAATASSRGAAAEMTKPSIDLAEELARLCAATIFELRGAGGLRALRASDSTTTGRLPRVYAIEQRRPARGQPRVRSLQDKEKMARSIDPRRKTSREVQRQNETVPTGWSSNLLSASFLFMQRSTTHSMFNAIWSAVRRIDSFELPRINLGVRRQLRLHKLGHWG
jgi:hypothetical protein